MKPKQCRVCGKPKRDCVLPCLLATSAFTEDEKLVRWLAHVYTVLNDESDRLDPERKRQHATAACFDNAAKNLATAISYISGKTVWEVL